MQKEGSLDLLLSKFNNLNEHIYLWRRCPVRVHHIRPLFSILIFYWSLYVQFFNFRRFQYQLNQKPMISVGVSNPIPVGLFMNVGCLFGVRVNLTPCLKSSKSKAAIYTITMKPQNLKIKIDQSFWWRQHFWGKNARLWANIYCNL